MKYFVHVTDKRINRERRARVAIIFGDVLKKFRIIYSLSKDSHDSLHQAAFSPSEFRLNAELKSILKTILYTLKTAVETGHYTALVISIKCTRGNESKIIKCKFCSVYKAISLTHGVFTFEPSWHRTSKTALLTRAVKYQCYDNTDCFWKRINGGLGALLWGHP